jgi:hypothetical protein
MLFALRPGEFETSGLRALTVAELDRDASLAARTALLVAAAMGVDGVSLDFRPPPCGRACTTARPPPNGPRAGKRARRQQRGSCGGAACVASRSGAFGPTLKWRPSWTRRRRTRASGPGTRQQRSRSSGRLSSRSTAATARAGFSALPGPGSSRGDPLGRSS